MKLTVKAGLEHFRNQVVLIETHNNVDKAYINYLRGRFFFSSSIALDLWSMCYQAHILPVASCARSTCGPISFPNVSTITSTSLMSRRSSRSSTVGIARIRWGPSPLRTTGRSIAMCRGSPIRPQPPSMHAPAQGQEPLSLPLGHLHPSAAPRGASSTVDGDSGRP